MKSPTLYMETTAIPPLKTAGEITELLVRAGATQIGTEFDNGRISGLRFSIPVKGLPGAYSYKLPVRIEPVFKLLNGRRPEESWKRGNQTDWADRDHEQAERVAWRQLLRWIQAQLAMIETGMAETPEVFLPYMQAESGQSMYQLFQAHAFKVLEAPTQQD
jgi:hypothetical protein